MMDIRTNSSNNTVFADSSGNIAYFYGNFIPRRNPEFDFSKQVDGSNPATDWQGLHSVAVGMASGRWGALAFFGGLNSALLLLLAVFHR